MDLEICVHCGDTCACDAECDEGYCECGCPWYVRYPNYSHEQVKKIKSSFIIAALAAKISTFQKCSDSNKEKRLEVLNFLIGLTVASDGLDPILLGAKDTDMEFTGNIYMLLYSTKVLKELRLELYIQEATTIGGIKNFDRLRYFLDAPSQTTVPEHCSWDILQCLDKSLKERLKTKYIK